MAHIGVAHLPLGNPLLEISSVKRARGWVS
jgi:hypothetical protein